VSDYNRRTWLNPKSSSSTGSVVCCHMPSSESRHYPTFIEIADCKGKITLHPADGESMMSFIAKLSILKEEIDMFMTALEIDIKQESLFKMECQSGRN
jgi:hypothetical protein